MLTSTLVLCRVAQQPAVFLPSVGQAPPRAALSLAFFAARAFLIYEFFFSLSECFLGIFVPRFCFLALQSLLGVG